MELGLLLRNGEQLLVTLGIPTGLLVFFSLVDVLPTGEGAAVAFLAPGIVALAVIASALVSLSIATGFERSNLVLKRLGATPLRRSELVGAKAAAVLAVFVLQLLVITAVALGLGWRPRPAGVPLAALAVVLGVAAHAGVGLVLAGRLPALTNLAVTNAAFVVLLLCSGIVFPLEVLPDLLAGGARLLPSSALAELLREALDADPARALGRPLAVLSAWAVGAPAAAARLFRWD